jgi:hypothetical protein
MDVMGQDFEFSDDGRRVRCTRGGPQAADGDTAGDAGWWYLAVAGAAPVRLRRVRVGETRRDVWESALDHLDGAG